MGDHQLRLFVYGTLKRGFANHRRFCRRARFVTDARIEGRLYQLPPGYPGLVIPETNVLAEGTSNLQADLEILNRPLAVRRRSVGGSARPTTPRVSGEVLAFCNPKAALREIDLLEGFRPGRESLYRRVLAEVSPPGQATLVVWVYVISEPSPGARLLPQGVWPEANPAAQGLSGNRPPKPNLSATIRAKETEGDL